MVRRFRYYASESASDSFGGGKQIDCRDIPGYYTSCKEKFIEMKKRFFAGEVLEFSGKFYWPEEI